MAAGGSRPFCHGCGTELRFALQLRIVAANLRENSAHVGRGELLTELHRIRGGVGRMLVEMLPRGGGVKLRESFDVVVGKILKPGCFVNFVLGAAFSRVPKHQSGTRSPHSPSCVRVKSAGLTRKTRRRSCEFMFRLKARTRAGSCSRIYRLHRNCRLYSGRAAGLLMGNARERPGVFRGP